MTRSNAKRYANNCTIIEQNIENNGKLCVLSLFQQLQAEIINENKVRQSL